MIEGWEIDVAAIGDGDPLFGNDDDMNGVWAMPENVPVDYPEGDDEESDGSENYYFEDPNDGWESAWTAAHNAGYRYCPEIGQWYNPDNDEWHEHSNLMQYLNLDG